MKFGKILREMRKRAGMSQEDVALELHMSISNVSRLETDIYDIRAADLVRWANITNSQEMLVAIICGVDSLPVMQQVMESLTGVVGTVLLGGVI